MPTSAQPYDQHASVSLRAERLIRSVARAGNRAIAGVPIVLRVEDRALRARLAASLERMGARVCADEFLVGADVKGSTTRALVISDQPEPQRPGADSQRGAGAGARIDWAAEHMRATSRIAGELASSGALRGERVLLSLVLEPKTAALALAVARTGAEVAVFGAANETDPGVASELAARGCAVFAPMGHVAPAEADARDREHAAAALEWAPTLLVDDGAHLIRLAHTEHQTALSARGGQLRAASEETTSGVRPLEEMAAAGELLLPVIAANDARTKLEFDNLIGTGQSCVFAVGDLLDSPRALAEGIAAGVEGTRWAVIGYGPVGVGVARFAAALGARITVVEHDAVRALAAMHDGHEALPLAEALSGADIVVSATGVWHTLDAAALRSLRPGAVVAVAGGIDDEIGLDELRAAGWHAVSVGDHIDEWRPPGGGIREQASTGFFVLAGGGGVNYTAAEGNPIDAMDLSFATQLVALDRLVGQEFAPGLHRLRVADEDRVARAALAAFGGSADPRAESGRPGGAAQDWRVHRYRA